MNRRNFLKYSAIGAGSITIAGSSAAGWHAYNAGLLIPDESPFAPWSALETIQPHDPIALAAGAILASNPHNTQPWKIFSSTKLFELQADTTKHLGSFDPFRREMWIGLGCAIANAEIIGSAYGFYTGSPTVQNTGKNGAGKISMTVNKREPNANPLATAIPHRRTNRAPYTTTKVDDSVLAAIQDMVEDVKGAQFKTFSRTSKFGKLFAEGTVEATETINNDSEMSHDGHIWFRENARMTAKYRDGVSIPTAGLTPAMSLLGQLMPKTNEKKSGDYWLASTKRQVTNTGGFGIITVHDLYDRTQQVEAGRLWQRIHLALTAKGLAAQPMNQLPELVDRDLELDVDRGWDKKLSKIAGTDKKTTFAFRFGVPTRTVPYSARRPIDWVLL